MNEETLFQLAIEKPQEERAAFLDSACADDADLRYRVNRLLLAYENPGSFLQQPVMPSSGKTQDEPTQADDSANARQADGAKTQAEPNHPTHESDLAFLTPTTKPDSLGRLEHFEILEIVGKGGFGTVLRAFDEKLHRIVAIKVLAADLSASGTARQRFIREARTGAAVVHEHVVTIHAVVEDHRPPYLVMQMIDGVTLQQKLDKTGTLSMCEILRIGMQMAQALDAAHKQGLVHRDIKPANVLLENGVERVKITDFGLARAVDDASVTQSGTVAGTPMYMSPEQAEGVPIDHRSDLFSLGTVLYAMCAGHPPFRASGTHAVLKRVIDASPRPIREINDEIPDWLCDIIAKLHAKKPEDRFQTAKEVAELLGQHLAHVQQPNVTPKPVPPSAPRPTPAVASSRLWWVASRGILLGAIFGVSVGIFGMILGSLFMPGNWLGWWALPTAILAAAVASVVGFAIWTVFALLPMAEQAGARKRVVARRLSGVASILAGIFVVLVVAVFDWSEVGLGIWTWLRGGEAIFLTTDDPDLLVTINGEHIHDMEVRGPGFNQVSLPVGSYSVSVRCGDKRKLDSVSLAEWRQSRTYPGDQREDRFDVELRRGQRLTLVIRTSVLATEPGRVQLFNRKDLTGWKTPPQQPGEWKVKEGLLVSEDSSRSHLFSERGDYQNFHLRVRTHRLGLQYQSHESRFTQTGGNFAALLSPVASFQGGVARAAKQAF